MIKIITMMKEFNISVLVNEMKTTLFMIAMLVNEMKTTLFMIAMLVNEMKTTLFMIAIKICLWIITIVKPF